MKVATITTAIGTLMASLAALGALYFSNSTLGATNEQLGLARRTAQSEQIKLAAEQLDSDKESVRLSGIYLIERLAEDSEADVPDLRRLLEAFVRTQSTSGPCELPPPESPEKYRELIAPADIQAALDMIMKYSVLSVYTPRVNIQGACLVETALTGANLSIAVLADANLTGAVLENANLTSTILDGANLTEAVLTRADLTGVNLQDVNLTGAFLDGANLPRATLTGANLTGIEYDDSTTWPEGFIPPRR
ncbi:pentapeptide repeat-containing protein [Nocardia carnea]|uniref:pentapeptide repeat-containing protein n=3 Tax=Nocardia carnea TaxID=37328 RepID=UPI002456E45A|nr:pentapeptide repeat-containing protein [Nocardia carnea]